MSDLILKVRDLAMEFKTDNRKLKALDGVSFDVFKGETLGVVGESGCGKTTLGRCIMGLLKPAKGEIDFVPETVSRGMIFQDPYNSVDPYWTVEKIVAEGCNDKKQVKELLEKVGLNDEEKDKYPHELSGGQLQRVGIARTLGTNPQFIVCDEPVSALDVSYQSKIISLLEDLQEQDDLAYLFISHDLAVVRHISDRIMIMYKGQIMEIGDTDDIINDAKHPYTKLLLSAVPSPFTEKKEVETVNDETVSTGCPFASRCLQRKEICLKERPQLKTDEKGRKTACHLY